MAKQQKELAQQAKEERYRNKGRINSGFNAFPCTGDRLNGG
jgi:hypothetical protein